MRPEKNWFRRFRDPSLPHAAQGAPPSESAPAAEVPSGLVVKCAQCGEIVFSKDFERSLKVCPKCGHHHRLSAEERIAYTVDADSFAELPAAAALRSRDFLQFPDYQDKLDKAWSKVGDQDSFVVGTATLEERPFVLGVSQFAFMGGSMGSVTGEKIALALEEAVRRHWPAVLFTTSGGARMQEGLMSLMQMAKTSAACGRLAEAGLPLIVVHTDPTTAGVMASYASLGDVLLAEPGALVAFTGQRVAAQAAQGQKLPANYQSGEWRVEKGHIDAVVARRDLKAALGKLLALLGPEPASPAAASRESARAMPPAAAARNGRAADYDDERYTPDADPLRAASSGSAHGRNGHNGYHPAEPSAAAAGG